jgi:hypothetical protein
MPIRFLVAKTETGYALCEGGVYSTFIPEGAEYAGNNLPAAIDEWERLNKHYDGVYELFDALDGCDPIDANVWSSLEDWQRRLIPEAMHQNRSN